MDLARAPRRRPLTARKKGSGYENAFGSNDILVPRASRLQAAEKAWERGCSNEVFNLVPRASALIASSSPGPSSAALTVALGQAVDLRRNSDAEAWSHSICIPVAFLPKNMATAMNARKAYYKKQYILHLQKQIILKLS